MIPASAGVPGTDLQAQSERRRSNRLLWIFGAMLTVFALWSVLRDLFG